MLDDDLLSVDEKIQLKSWLRRRKSTANEVQGRDIAGSPMRECDEQQTVAAAADLRQMSPPAGGAVTVCVIFVVLMALFARIAVIQLWDVPMLAVMAHVVQGYIIPRLYAAVRDEKTREEGMRLLQTGCSAAMQLAKRGLLLVSDLTHRANGTVTIVLIAVWLWVRSRAETQSVEPEVTPQTQPTGAKIKRSNRRVRLTPHEAEMLCRELEDIVAINPEVKQKNETTVNLSNLFIADTGCGRSQFNDLKYFDRKTMRRFDHTSVGASGAFKTSWRGTARIPVPTQRGLGMIVMPNSTYNPKCPYNLVSLGRLSMEQGVKFGLPAWGKVGYAQFTNGIKVPLVNKMVLCIPPANENGINLAKNLANVEATASCVDVELDDLVAPVGVTKGRRNNAEAVDGRVIHAAFAHFLNCTS